MNLTFEPATPTDAEALLKAQIAAFNNDSVIYPGVKLGGPPGYDQLEKVIQQIREYDYTKIVYEGHIVGGMVVFDQGQGHFHLALLFIDPPHHNLGIGTRAIQFIERAYPATVWTLDTPTFAVRNQHFYEKFGYVKMRERLETDGITLIEYEKHVDDEDRPKSR